MKARNNIAYYEVLPRNYYEKYKYHKRSLMRQLDNRILDAGQWFIERHGTCYLNNWYWGGIHDSRGWRTADDPDGSELSQHKYGRALDLVPKYKTILEIHLDIIRNPDLYIQAEFTTFECMWDATSWIHGDCRSHNINGLLFVSYDGSAYNLNEYINELKERGHL